MAELVGGALLGALVSELLTILKKFKHRNESISRLQTRLENLTPLVEALGFSQTDSGHPALEKWLRDLHQQLQMAHDLVAKPGGSVKRMLKSGQIEEINNRISQLLADSIVTILWQQIELRREVGQVLKFTSPHLMEKELKLTTGRLDRATHSNVGAGLSPSTSSAMNLQWSRACDIPDPPQVTFGGTAVADELIENMLHGEYRKWIVLWGMGGVGKTFTANKVYHDSSINQHFTGGTYWVTVSKDQPPPHHILKVLYNKIVGDGARSDFPDDLDAARSVVRALLNRDKILLVLDDVWQPSILQDLDVISEDKKGVILMTTRDTGNLDSVSTGGGHLKRIVDYAKIVEIPRLSTEHSWQLFSWHAFDVYGKSVPPDLETVARDVAQECKELPLALKVIGSSMGRIYLSPSDIKLGRSLQGEWEKALHQLQNVSHHKDEYESLYQKLQLSVDSLIDQHHHLKDCFFYFAAYPEDFDVPVEELVSIWAAEGLCTEEEEGKTLLGYLIAKSMIELTGRGRSCKIHDVMRDLVQRNLKFYGEQESQRKCLYAPGSSLDVFPRDWTTRDVQLSVERLSIQYNADLDKLPDQFNAPNLRVLLGHYNSLKVLCPGFFQSLSDLRVLVLSRTDIVKVPGSVLRNLKSLVLLDLTDCERLLKVSDKLDSLQNLETVLLEGCNHLWRLPRMKSLTKLHTLSVHLPVSYADGYCWPSGYTDVLDISRSALIETIWSAPPIFLTLGMRSLGRYGLHDVFQLCSLRRLNINAEYHVRWHLPNVSSLYALVELKVSWCGQIPAGLMGLHNLKVLQIVSIDDVALPPLDKLPLLEELSIIWCEHCRLPESFGRNGAFPSLRKLALHAMDYGLFTFNVGTMPKLEILSLRCCDWGSKDRFINAQHAVSLTTLSTLKCLCLDEEWFREADLDALFREPNCFPNLEHLVFTNRRAKLPQHILEREALGKLKIETFDFTD